MEKLQRPLFVIAYILLILAFALQMGSSWFHKTAATLTPESIATVRAGYGNDPPSDNDLRASMQKLQSKNAVPPGYGTRYLCLPDAILLLTMTWMVLSLFVPQRIQGRIQGIVTLVAALIIGILSFIKLYVTLGILTLMLSLLLAAPFGTLVYFAIWGFFAAGSAKLILSLSMFLKIGFVILLFLAQQRFLRVKSMLLLVATSIGLTFLAALLIGIVPAPLASITDAIAGIIDAAAALIWAIVLAIMSLISILRAIRVDRSSATAEG